MVHTVTVSPILDVSGKPNRLYYNCFTGFAKSQNKKYLVTVRYIQSFAELLPLHCTYHTATQSFLSRT